MIYGLFLWGFKKIPQIFKSTSCHSLARFEMQWIAEARTVVVALMHPCPAAPAALYSCARQGQNAVGSKDKYLFLIALRLIYTTVVERVGFKTGVKIQC